MTALSCDIRIFDKWQHLLKKKKQNKKNQIFIVIRDLWPCDKFLRALDREKLWNLRVFVGAGIHALGNIFSPRGRQRFKGTELYLIKTLNLVRGIRLNSCKSEFLRRIAAAAAARAPLPHLPCLPVSDLPWSCINWHCLNFLLLDRLLNGWVKWVGRR